MPQQQPFTVPRASNGVIIISTKEEALCLPNSKSIMHQITQLHSCLVIMMYFLLTSTAQHLLKKPIFHQVLYWDRQLQTGKHRKRYIGQVLEWIRICRYLEIPKVYLIGFGCGHLNQNGTLKYNNYKRFNGDIALSPSFLDKHLTLDMTLKGSLKQPSFVNRSHQLSYFF